VSLRVGLVGLPNVGKSTLFNAVSRARAEAANFPFSTIDPNVGVVAVPDPRLDRLAELAASARVVPATIEVVDIAGLVAGASRGEGLGNQFLAHIREVDAICHVVRCFEDDDIVHVSGSVDPARDIEVVDTELVLKDLETVERRLERARRAAKGGDRDRRRELEQVEALATHLAAGHPARTLDAELDDELRRELSLLTDKPVLYAANVAEHDLPDGNTHVDRVRDIARGQSAEVVVVSAQVEAELVELASEERAEFLATLGLDRSGLERLIEHAYRLLGLVTFFTAGPKEARAWTVPTGPPHRVPHARSTPTSNGGSSGPRSSRTPTTTRWAANPPRVTADGCGWRARTTWWPMATWSTSGSTSDDQETIDDTNRADHPTRGRRLPDPSSRRAPLLPLRGRLRVPDRHPPRRARTPARGRAGGRQSAGRDGRVAARRPAVARRPTVDRETMADAPLRENLTRAEAQARASQLANVLTHVHLDLTADDATFGSDTELTFEVLQPGPTFVDLTAASVERVELDGVQLDDEAVTPTRIELPALAPGEHRLRVTARMRYQHEGRGLHRFVDPTDGSVYLHSQFEPFAAHLVYACFDQPDLKSRFSLGVDAPAEWVVVSNSLAAPGGDGDPVRRWRFPTTPLLSPYVTAVVAGPYARVEDVYERADGTRVPLALYVRRSRAEHLDADEVVALTRQGLEFFEEAFGQPYPFEKYDQLFVPEFSFGAMENPGCVTFSESYVFRSRVTETARERRAETILHEMAHMWFGDLVTMRWWDDLWLNESFATFMSQLAQVSATRFTHAWVTFLDALKTWAKHQDQLPSTHPVAADMPDVESVHQNFDGITYAKGAAVLRQLVAWVGQDAFLAGCRRYFADHAWDNTSLADFLGALEQASGRSLDGWRDEWLLTTGINELVARVTLADDGTYGEVSVEQRDPAPPWAGLAGTPAHRPTLRRHRITLGVYDLTDGGLERREQMEIDVEGPTTRIDALEGREAGAALLLDDDDLTYAKIRPDPASTEVLLEHLPTLADPLARAQVWSLVWDLVRDGRLAARRFLATILRSLDDEDHIGVLERLHARAIGAAERYVAPATRGDRLRELADQASEQVTRAAPGSDAQLAWVRHWASTARTDAAHLAAVRAVLDGEVAIDGLDLDVDLRWHLVTALARAGAIDLAQIEAERERDPTDLGERHAATARASLPDARAKAWAWTRLVEEETLSHTMSRQLLAGFARIDQSDVLAGYTDRYFDVLDDVWATRSIEWAIEFSEAAFPHWDASDALVARADELLVDTTPRPLQRVLLEQRDVLTRTLAARAVDADA
jgi:aminopeptidase N